MSVKQASSPRSLPSLGEGRTFAAGSILIMTSAALLERLQQALSPEYHVERELASGGMGIVFIARDVTLQRAVAVKIIRPELATADAAELFLHEARILARVRHPNIVTVYHAGEALGLFYYIMELVDGETLHDRLRRGPLPPIDALKLGRDLLDGLETVHGAGIVHRDVKPGNIFLLNHRALLADFGIAQPPSEEQAERRRTSRHVQGTPGYMAPEQMMGGAITAQADIFAAGAVIYEAYTGKRLPALGENVDWSGVPRAVARVLRRAVAASPEDRWPAARSFRQALWRTRTSRYVARTAALTGAGLLVGVLSVPLFNRLRPTEASAGTVSVHLAPFAFIGRPEQKWIGDSLVHLLRSELNGHPDFRVSDSPRFLPAAAGSLTLHGRVEVTSTDVRAEIVSPMPRGAGSISRSAVGLPLSDWPALADSLTYQILLTVWDAKSPLAGWLPLRVLPRTPLGLARFLEAERLVADALWGEAYRAYTIAEATDSTCLLCSWRVNEIERWLSREHDPARVRRYLAYVDSFPPWYQSLIRAGQMPLVQRLDTLHRVTERSPGFFLAWFQQGDELFHRGPLIGHQRGEAIAPLETSVRLRPDFGPTWEHLAWVFTAEGDSAGAARALAALDRRGPVRDPFSQVYRSLLDLGFAWRFLSTAEATRRTEDVLSNPTAREYPDAGAGPRLLPAFDAPGGALVFGQIMASGTSRDLTRSGLIAQVLGAVALGQIARARESAHRLVAVSPEPEIALFVAELEAALPVIDNAVRFDPQVLQRLRRFATAGAGSEQLRSRAAWMSALTVRRQPVERPRGPEMSAWIPGSDTRALTLFLAADSLASAGQARQALALSDALPVDTTARRVDPFYRVVARLKRAQWRAEIGDIEGAREELHWYQHTDLAGLPTGFPQAAEIDWAFGTLARWRLARLLEGGTDHMEACSAYQGVVRHWSDGDPPYAARADSARDRMRELHCDA